VTVVKSVFDDERANKLGESLVKKIAGQTNTYAGDGTTTATILAEAVIRHGIQMVEEGGVHPVALKIGLNKAKKEALKLMKQMALPVDTYEEMLNVALVSSNYDRRISEVVSRAMERVSSDGQINLTDSPTGQTFFGTVKGFVFPRGFVSEQFLPDDKSQVVEMDFPCVLVIGGKVTEIKQIMGAVEAAKAMERPLLLFCEDI